MTDTRYHDPNIKRRWTSLFETWKESVSTPQLLHSHQHSAQTAKLYLSLLLCLVSFLFLPQLKEDSATMAAREILHKMKV